MVICFHLIKYVDFNGSIQRFETGRLVHHESSFLNISFIFIWRFKKYRSQKKSSTFIIILFIV